MGFLLILVVVLGGYVYMNAAMAAPGMLSMSIALNVGSILFLLLVFYLIGTARSDK